jgi:hypothetical protein
MDRVFASAFTSRLSRGPLTGLALTFLMVLSPSVASGQSPLERVHHFLDSASDFNLLGEVQRGVLQSNENMSIAVTLLEGTEYMVVAYCGEGCGNLDLALFDDMGNEVQADRLPDTEPLLALSAEKTGAFQILAETGECPDEGCVVAVGVMASTDEPGVLPGEDMGGRLEIFGMQVRALGFTKSGKGGGGHLEHEEAVKIPVPLEKGLEYRIAGTCDLDCYDLDLALFDPQGVEITTDFMDDDFPILGFVPDTTAVYQLEVIMIGCGLAPCAFRTISYTREVQAAPPDGFFSGEVVSYQNIRGELQEDDDLLADMYFDVYEVDMEAGQRLILDLRSEEFDTLLRLLDADGKGEENDDFGLELGHSRLEKIVTTAGKYSVQVASATPYSTGSYELQIAVVR